MTCKDCLYYEVCTGYIPSDLDTNDVLEMCAKGKQDKISNIEELCPDFKDKTRYVEIKHGKWKEYFAYDCWHYDCPFCDFGFATKIRQEDPPNYCENCGAKMDSKEGAEE